MSDHRDDFIIAIRYALLIFLSISILVLDKFSLPFMRPVRAILNDFIYHVSVISVQPKKLSTFLVQKTKAHYNVISENKILREEMEYLNPSKYNGCIAPCNSYHAGADINSVLVCTYQASGVGTLEQNIKRG